MHDPVRAVELGVVGVSPRDGRRARGRFEYGVPACLRSRVWVVDVDGLTITIVATPDDASSFESVIYTADALLGSITIGD